MIWYTEIFEKSLSSVTKKKTSVPKRYAQWFADSEMQRFPEAWQLDHGKLRFLVMLKE